MRLRQVGDGAAIALCAGEKHAATAKAPHGSAVRIQAAGLPTRRPASPVCQRVPAQADDAAPMDPQHPTSDSADIC